MSCVVCGKEVPTSADYHPLACDGCDVRAYITALKRPLHFLLPEVDPAQEAMVDALVSDYWAALPKRILRAVNHSESATARKAESVGK